jgi:hypothetical protein
MWLPFSDYLPESIFKVIVSTNFGEIMRIMYTSLEVATAHLTQLAIQQSLPDVIVKPLVGQYGALEPIDPVKLIKEGYRAMESCLPTLKSSYSLKNSFVRITKYGGLKKP